MNEPVLLIAFNRPDDFSRLLDRLRTIEPSRLFIAIDGPRPDVPSDRETVARTRALIDTIDWPCQIETLIREENLGCGKGVSSAISWFFNTVERGIILEDDLLPDPSFFDYCIELLDRYQDDDRVFAVAGCNHVPAEFLDTSRPYRFSQVPHIWGWATWRRSWQTYRLDIAGWRKELPWVKRWRPMGSSVMGVAYWSATFDLLAKGQIDTWDGQLVFAAMRGGGLVATPNVNLVENLGFGATATHTVEKPKDLQPVEAIALPTEPVPVVVDERAQRWTLRHHYHATVPGFAQQATRYLKQRRRRST